MTSTDSPGTLVLLRHGTSVGNAREIFSGLLDVSLTPDGEASCLEAGDRLRRIGWRADQVFTSELTRGIQTADLVARSLGYTGTVSRDWRLNERNYGGLTGHLKSEIAERHGHERYLHWRRSYDGRPPPIPPERLDLWRRLPPFDRLPAGALTPTESLADVVVRQAPWVNGPLAQELRAGRHVLVAAHGNTLRALCGVLDDLDETALRALNLPNARPLRYDFDRDLRPRTPGGTYLDPELAAAEAVLIAAEGGT